MKTLLKQLLRKLRP
jgi:cephalosporin hydroxylase